MTFCRNNTRKSYIPRSLFNIYIFLCLADSVTRSCACLRQTEAALALAHPRPLPQPSPSGAPCSPQNNPPATILINIRASMSMFSYINSNL